MKKIVMLLAALVIALLLYLWLKPHHQDPHYYAAVCVVLNEMETPKDAADFKAKLKTVIINENSSYAMNKTTFDAASARQAIAAFAALSDKDKMEARQGVESCLNVLIPGSSAP